MNSPQPMICPRCKFRLTNAKAICNTCGYAFQSGRVRMPEPAAPAPVKPMIQSVAVQSHSQSHSSASQNTNSSVNSMRKAQSAAPTGGSFWRAFFGLDPLPTEQSEVSET